MRDWSYILCSDGGSTYLIPDAIELVNFTGLEINHTIEKSGELSLIQMNPRLLEWDFIFMDESELIISPQQITTEHIDNFRWILFGIIHEIESHIKHDKGNSRDPKKNKRLYELEHEAFGNDVVGDVLGHASFEKGGNIEPNTDADRVFDEIASIPNSVLASMMFKSLSNFRVSENKNSNRIWIPSSPLNPGHWEVK